MSYTPTSWVDGKTPVNAQNMNKIEEGIRQLDANKLDSSALQDAVDSALAQAKASGAFDGPQGPKGDNVLIVNVVPDTTAPDAYKADKTNQEILEAVSDGRSVVCLLAMSNIALQLILITQDAAYFAALGIFPGDSVENSYILVGIERDKTYVFSTQVARKEDIPTEDHINAIIDEKLQDVENGKDGKDGVSATHSWNGTILTITSASGTSSANLKGEKGDKGDTGAAGANGKDGTNGKDGADGQPGADGKDGEPGKDGVSCTHAWNGTTLSVTSASGTSSANLKGEKGDKGDTGTKGDKGDKGDTGATGQRGTGLLPVTTAPSDYTTAVNGLTPAYRIALSTVKSQASTAAVYAGDTIRHSYYHYPVIYVDSSYVYCGTRVSIRGATGSAASVTSANIESALGYTPADAADVIAINDSLFEEATVTHEVKGANIIPENMQWVEGYTIKNWSAGTTTMNDLNTSSGSYTSEIIEVEPGVEYAMVNATGGASGRGAMGIYDANGVSIKYLKAADGNNIPVPSNGKYIRFTCNESQKSAVASIQPVDVSGQTWVSKVASRTEIVTETVTVDKIQMFEESMMKRSRFIVFSDIHYNENSSSVAASDERMQLLVDAINAEHAKRTVDFCIFNGDIAIGYAKSSVEAFATKWADKFKMPVFWFPGDHDDVNNANWIKIFGNQRQASLEDSNFYFIWLDVYSDANDDGTESSGVRTSTTIDTAWVEQEISKAGTKPIILLTHYVYCDTWYPGISNLLNNYPQIKAVISSHSHNNSVGTIGDNNAVLVNTGNFSYPNGADWSKKGSNNEHLWGFANFETMDGGLYHWYIQPAYNYTNASVNMPYTEGEKSLVLTIGSAKDGADIDLTKHRK